jgi:hypothetical protein
MMVRAKEEQEEEEEEEQQEEWVVEEGMVSGMERTNSRGGLRWPSRRVR